MTTDLHGPPPVPGTAQCHLGEVISVADPDARGRIQVRLHAYDGPQDQEARVWARVVVPFAGDKRGAFLVPDVGDEVLVQFAGGDSRCAVVVGALWNGKHTLPEKLGGEGKRVDRWSLTGKHGTRVAIVEEGEKRERIELSTPNGVKASLRAESGGKLELRVPGNTVITLSSEGVKVETGARVQVKASETEVTSGMVTVNAAVSTFNGTIVCKDLHTNSVVSKNYSPGTGNLW